MLNELMEEYQMEMEKFKDIKGYWQRQKVWLEAHPEKRPWDFPEERPEPNKAKLKRLGIMIRQKMIEAEKRVDRYE